MPEPFKAEAITKTILNSQMHVPLLVNRRFSELNPLVVGEEHCKSGHTFGPAIRDYVLIHYVLSGCGSITVGEKTYNVQAGEAFLILPDEVTVYSADTNDPWFYRWIGFNGKLSEKFKEASRVFSPSSRIFNTIGRAIENEDMREYCLCAALFELYADTFSSSTCNPHYVRRVRDFINASYMSKISVEHIAEEMNLDRRYLSRIFKAKTGQTIQDYIVSVRLTAASERLKNGATVSEAALLSGYDDECNFSKMFKRRYGISPGAWRRENS